MNLTQVSTLEAAVAEGVAYLDGRYPGWRWRIQADMIEPGCPEHSITGQLFGEELANQLVGVGLLDVTMEPNDVNASRIMTKFCAMGFATLMHIPFYPSDSMKAEALATVGVELPGVIAIPRDQDVCLMELATLAMLWEQEVAKR